MHRSDTNYLVGYVLKCITDMYNVKVYANAIYIGIISDQYVGVGLFRCENRNQPSTRTYHHRAVSSQQVSVVCLSKEQSLLYSMSHMFL